MYKARILANLNDHHGKWVAVHCILRGLPFDSDVQQDIQDLILDGTIEKKEETFGFDKWNRPIRLPLYRYIEPFVPENEKRGHLKVVK